MIKTILCCFTTGLLTFSTAGWSAPKSISAKPVIPVPDVAKGEIAIFENGNYRKVKTIFQHGLTLSLDCIKKGAQPSCLAFSTSLAAPPPPTSKFNGNPASQNCSEFKGANLIAFNAQKQEVNYCQFADGSMVNSWDLYYKRHPPTYIK